VLKFSVIKPKKCSNVELIKNITLEKDILHNLKHTTGREPELLNYYAIMVITFFTAYLPVIKRQKHYSSTNTSIMIWNVDTI